MKRSLSVVLGLAVCAPAWAGATRSFGKPLQGLKPAALGDVLAKPQDGRSIRVEGTIHAVCRNKGCWIELSQGESAVHVTFEGYSFFLPRDVAGKRATIEGRVVVEPSKPAEVKHLQAEGAGEAAAAQVSIEAYGVEVE